MSRCKYGIGIVVLVLASMIACRDSVESHYASVTDATREGMFDRGWLPQILKPDAKDITVWRDIASNEVRGKFALNPAATDRIHFLCKPTSDRPRRAWWMPRWFPSSINQGDARAHGLQIFRCDDYFVATEPSSGNGYFWELGEQFPRN